MMVCYSASVVTTSVTELGGPRGLQLRLGGVYLSNRAYGGARLGDCAHPEDHEEEAEGMEDLEVEITV